jgi:glycosyltransferase involved in cell wall biosynthesis
MIDTKGNLDAQKPDVIDRHLKYAAAFDQKCGMRGEKGKLLVLGRNVNASNFESQYLDIIKITNSKWLHLYFWETRKFLSREEGKAVTLVAGDPWHSTLIALLIKFTIGKRVMIESQLHFDFLNFFKSKGFFLSRVLPRITLSILGLVDQIRVVDRNSLELLHDKINPNIEVYFAPSLINIDSTFTCSRSVGRNPVPRLLFVGRLHEERNPKDFIRFLRRLDSKGFEFEAQIVGSGPQADELKSDALDLVARNVLKFTGELSGKDLLEQYCRSDVLISCAKHESYGRAMREALYLGAKVLTFETTGSNSLQKEVGTKFVSYVSSDETPDQLQSKIKALVETEVDNDTKQELGKRQDEILETLSEHWDSLIKQSV